MIPEEKHPTHGIQTQVFQIKHVGENDPSGSHVIPTEKKKKHLKRGIRTQVSGWSTWESDSFLEAAAKRDSCLNRRCDFVSDIPL